MSQSTLVPYLSFQGTCEEALNLYKDVFSGKIEIVNRYDMPAMKAPENYKNKILHAVLTFGNNTIMACDVFPGRAVQTDGGNIKLSVSLKDQEETKRIFNKLADGGNITMPLDKQFFAALHGHVTDKFGTR